MELTRSLLNEILGKLYKGFRPDFFTAGSPAYRQQISKKIYWSLYFEVVQIYTWSLLFQNFFFLSFAKPVTNDIYT